MKGMTMNVYRTAAYGSCTNGPSAQADTILVVSSSSVDVPEIFEQGARPAFELIEWAPCGEKMYKLVPVGIDNGRATIGPMFGGNYAASSDSRLPHGAVPIHDRYETPDPYYQHFHDDTRREA